LKKGKINKIRSDNGESRDRALPDLQPNAHPTSKFNTTEQQHISYSSFMSTALLGQIGRKQERVMETSTRRTGYQIVNSATVKPFANGGAWIMYVVKGVTDDGITENATTLFFCRTGKCHNQKTL
jgi:hypothetical protein